MGNYRVVAIVQARVSSTRLPRKVLLDIAGQPMLEWVVKRTCQAKNIAEVVVASTTDSSDQPIEKLCKHKSYPLYRGSQYDVLDRYYQAAVQFKAEIIVRITADCPLIDPGVIDKTVDAFLDYYEFYRSEPFDDSDHKSFPGVDRNGLKMPFAANRLPPPWGRTYPIGLDTEVCSFEALELAWNEANQQYQREHVMPFFYEDPQRFQIIHVKHDRDLGKLRLTVDTLEDLELVRQICNRFPGREDFSWLEVLELLEHEPALLQINDQIVPKHYRQVDERLNP